MASKLGEYFNFMGHRYYRAYFGGLSKSLAYEKMEARRRFAPQFLWAIKRESDGTWSLGRRVK